MRLATDNLVKTIKSKRAIELSDGQIHLLQKVALDMACDVISICEERGFLYTLGGGTCLGAIRHHGFIPWDDDFDLNIERKNYGELMNLLEERFGNKYWIFRPEVTKDYGYPRAQIQRKGTRVRALSDTSPERCGVSLDIFIVENVADNPIARNIHGVLSMASGFALSCRRYYRLRDEVDVLLEKGSEVEKSIHFKEFIGKILSFISLEKWTYLTDKIHSICKNEQSRLIVIPSGRRHYFGEIYERSIFYPVKLVNFEGHQWAVPGEYELYLTAMYGKDFMQVPAPEKRESHLVLEFDLEGVSDEYCTCDDGR